MVTLILPPPTKPICQHCRLRPVNRPRSLCWRCFYAAGVRERYPVDPVYGRRGLANICGALPLAPEPTAARPGTAEKVAVMEQRASAGFALWHPHDAPAE